MEHRLNMQEYKIEKKSKVSSGQNLTTDQSGMNLSKKVQISDKYTIPISIRLLAS